MNLVDLVYKNARIYPDRPAFVGLRPVSRLREGTTWKEFNDRTNSLANALAARGIKRGERVFLLGRNSLQWVEAFFSVVKLGAWITPLNFRFTKENVEYCGRVAEPAAFIFDEEFVPIVREVQGSLPSIRDYVCIGTSSNGFVTTEELIGSAPSTQPAPAPADEEECGLYFTSGTTGTPKPILLLHKNLFCTAVNEVTNLRQAQEDSLLMIPPLYHLAIGHMLGSMLAGAKTVLLTEAVTPQYIFEAIQDEEIRVVFLLVPWALDILEGLDKGTLKRDAYRLDQWRVVEMGAQPIPTSLVERWKRYFPWMAFNNTFGLSESSGPGTINLGLGNERKVGAIGKPGLLWDARVVNEHDEDMPVGEVGEIIVKGMGVMKGYYKNEELTAQTLRNGWLHTGDLGKIDEEGFIYLVDRKKDLVISGGENIFPVEVEGAILKHPKVRDVAVIGTEDKRLGEAVTAVIEAVPGEIITEEEIKAFCEEHLPRYKRPRRIIFDSVPRSGTGKIEKLKLRAKYSKERG
jgi:acyl-CoA synthetase (AMP-forming)/AMP-acid ligase II